MHEEQEEAFYCMICDQMSNSMSKRALTNCSHEFCLNCIIQHLRQSPYKSKETTSKNQCPVCQDPIKTIHEETTKNSSLFEKEKKIKIKYCNVIFFLNVSIWSVDDPVKTLAELFQL